MDAEPEPEMEQTMEAEAEPELDLRTLTLEDLRDYYTTNRNADTAMAQTISLATRPVHNANSGRREGFHSTGKPANFSGVKIRSDVTVTHKSWEEEWEGNSGCANGMAGAKQRLLEEGYKIDYDGVRCIVPNLLYISPPEWAQDVANLTNAGITHVINLSGKGPKASQEEGAVEPEGGWPVEPEWPNPAEEQFQEGENYLHICRDPDEITSMLQSTRSLDLDTDVMEYVRPAVEFLKAKSKIPTFTGCLVHSGCDTSSRASAVVLGWLIQESDLGLCEAYALLTNNKIDAQLHRSFFQQLLKMSEKLLGAGAHRKAAKKEEMAGAWGDRWEPEKTTWGEGGEGFKGIDMPTADEPGFFKIKAFHRCIHEGPTGKCHMDETPNPTGGVPDGLCDLHRPDPEEATKSTKKKKKR